MEDMAMVYNPRVGNVISMAIGYPKTGH